MNFNLTQSNMPLKYPPKSFNQINNNNIIQSSQFQSINNSQQQLPSSPTSSSSKLHKYFGSSEYLSTQQQLAVFIQNFPIINIHTQHKSINEIIPLLIKQNQLLGKKCHSQVLLIKQSFSKHQSINKQYKSAKLQIQQIRNQCQSIIKQKDNQLVSISKQLDQLNDRVNTYQQFIITQNVLFKNVMNAEYKKVQEILTTKQTKQKYNKFIEMITRQQSINNINQIYIKQDNIIQLNAIQKHSKQQKRRVKYYSRVKSSVQQFCNRLVKITQVVPPQIITKQLKYQCQQFISIISQLISVSNGESKRKRQTSSSSYIKVNDRRSKSRERQRQRQRQRQRILYQHQEERQINNRLLANVNSQSSLNSRFSNQNLLLSSNNNNNNNNNANNNYINNNINERLLSQKQTISMRNYALGSSSSPQSFEHILNSFMSQTIKKHQQQISLLQLQIHQTKQQLIHAKQQQLTSKQYYQGVLIQTKIQYEKQKRQFDQQSTLKDQMIRHFQEQLQKCFAIKQQLQHKLQIYSRQNQEMKQSYTPKTKQIQSLKKDIITYQQTITKLREKTKKIQQQHEQLINKIQQQHKQQLNKLQQKHKNKLQQHQLQISNKTLTIKQKQQQITLMNTQLRSLKQTIEDKNIQINRITKKLNLIQHQQVNNLQQKVQTLQKEYSQTKKINKNLNKTIQELNHQINLHTTYIQQLQTKTQKKDQTIDKLNKKLSTLQIDKKSTNKLKQTITNLEQKLILTQKQYKKLSQQNINLKKLVKQMKKQLQSVYHTINDLKVIQQDREKLIIQSQKSQRWRQQIMKDYDQMKFQILKVQAENKSLALQLRHYKNALKRIQMIN